MQEMAENSVLQSLKFATVDKRYNEILDTHPASGKSTLKLEQNHRWSKIAGEAPLASSNLVNDIVNKTDGVFLRVRLVMLSLLKELQNHDNLSDLRKRLDLIPRDLEALYILMLQAIEPRFYLEDASQIFQVVRGARETREYITCNKWEELQPLTILELTLSRSYTEDVEGDTSEEIEELGEGIAVGEGGGNHRPSSSQQDCWSPLQPVLGDAQEMLLDELDQIVTSQHALCVESNEHWSSHSPLNMDLSERHNGWHDTFLSNAIQNGLLPYVRCRLIKDPSMISEKQGTLLLDYTIYPIPGNI
ncbi:hypothetical protein B0J14DRAFT_686102 [Halenospora varia]|nr:hypothetical protein B0J14DRAFT_686102 [Halenospora varia]